MNRTEPFAPPQPQWPTTPPPAEVALGVATAPATSLAALEAPAGRPPRGSWPDDDYRGWAGL